MITRIINRTILFILTVMRNTPLVGRYVQNNYFLTSLYLACIYRSRDIKKLRSTFLNVLDADTFRNEQSAKFWWFVMRFAVTCEQELRLMTFQYNPNEENNLIRVAMSGPVLKNGYDMSYVFTSISIWYFERGMLDNAIDMIQRATDADDKWAYPEFMLGWYGLFSDKVDPVEHFGEAVRRDWTMLARIRNDHACQQFPQVIKKVSQAVVVKPSNTSH